MGEWKSVRKDKIVFKAVCVSAFFALILAVPVMAKEVLIGFANGQYVQDEWVITTEGMSARYIPHKRHPVTYILKRELWSKITKVSMNMKLCTTIGAARANVYIDCGGNRDGFQINTYPHERLWKNTRQWQMSDHCLEILNKRGELHLIIRVYWDGHGVFSLSNLKMDVEEPSGTN